MKVIKRNGTEVPFNFRKIKDAIEAANACAAEKDRLSDTMVGFIVGNVEKRCQRSGGLAPITTTSISVSVRISL